MTTTTTAAKRGNESNAAKAGRLVGTLKSFGKLLKMPEPKQQTLQDCGGRDQHDAKNRAQSAAAAPVSAPAAPVSGHNSAKKKKRSFFGEVDDSRKPAASAPAPSSGPETSTPTLKRSRKDNVFTKSPENGPSRAATARQGLSRRVILPHGGAAAEARDKENMGPVWNATMREPSEQDKQPRKPEADDAGNDSDQEEASAPWSPLPPPMPSNAPDVPFIRTVDGQAMRLPVVGAAPEFTADPLFAAVHDQLEQLVGELSERAEYASGLASNAANLRHRAESLVRSKQAAVGQIKALIEQAGL